MRRTRGKAASAFDGERLIVGSATPEVTRPVRVFQEKDGQVLRTFESQTIEITATTDDETGVMHTAIEFNDAIERIGESMTQRSKIRREFDVPMLESIKELPKIRTAKYYLNNTRLFGAQGKALARERMFISNTVRSELHARAKI